MSETYVWVVVEHEKHEGSKILKIFSAEKPAQLWVYNQEWTNKQYKSGTFWLEIQRYPIHHVF